MVVLIRNKRFNTVLDDVFESNLGCNHVICLDSALNDVSDTLLVIEVDSLTCSEILNDGLVIFSLVAKN